MYEKELKDSLKEYLEREDVIRERKQMETHQSVEDIIHFIKRTHQEYLNAIKAVKEDIQYIIEICFKVVDAILAFFEKAFAKLTEDMNNNTIMVEYSKA